MINGFGKWRKRKATHLNCLLKHSPEIEKNARYTSICVHEHEILFSKKFIFLKCIQFKPQFCSESSLMEASNNLVCFHSHASEKHSEKLFRRINFGLKRLMLCRHQKVFHESWLIVDWNDIFWRQPNMFSIQQKKNHGCQRLSGSPKGN